MCSQVQQSSGRDITQKCLYWHSKNAIDVDLQNGKLSTDKSDNL